VNDKGQGNGNEGRYKDSENECVKSPFETDGKTFAGLHDESSKQKRISSLLERRGDSPGDLRSIQVINKKYNYSHENSPCNSHPEINVTG
jgi:hypothetical protein